MQTLTGYKDVTWMLQMGLTAKPWSWFRYLNFIMYQAQSTGNIQQNLTMKVKPRACQGDTKGDICRVPCCDCDKSYIGETRRTLAVRPAGYNLFCHNEETSTHCRRTTDLIGKAALCLGRSLTTTEGEWRKHCMTLWSSSIWTRTRVWLLASFRALKYVTSLCLHWWLFLF